MPATNTAATEAATATAAAAEPSSGRRRRDPEATKEAILDAAEQLFVQFGPSSTPTSQVAKAAGVTKSLIHHHFGSKDDLWLAVRRRHFERYHEVQRQMLEDFEGDGLSLLRQSMIAYFQYLQQDPNAARFMAWRTIEEKDPCLDLEHELFALGVQRLRESQEKGEIRDDIEPLGVIKTFLGMGLHWYQTRAFLCEICETIPELNPADLTDERYLEDAMKIFFEGIRPR